MEARNLIIFQRYIYRPIDIRHVRDAESIILERLNLFELIKELF